MKEIIKQNLTSTEVGLFVADFDDEIVHQFIQNNDSLLFVILRAPQPPEYYDLLGAANEEYFLDKLSNFSKYPNSVVLDFGHKYSSHSLFADLGHMNYKRASAFTKFLADTLMIIKELRKEY